MATDRWCYDCGGLWSHQSDRWRKLCGVGIWNPWIGRRTYLETPAAAAASRPWIVTLHYSLPSTPSRKRGRSFCRQTQNWFAQTDRIYTSVVTVVKWQTLTVPQSSCPNLKNKESPKCQDKAVGWRWAYLSHHVKVGDFGGWDLIKYIWIHCFFKWNELHQRLVRACLFGIIRHVWVISHLQISIKWWIQIFQRQPLTTL